MRTAGSAHIYCTATFRTESIQHEVSCVTNCMHIPADLHVRIDRVSLRRNDSGTDDDCLSGDLSWVYPSRVIAIFSNKKSDEYDGEEEKGNASQSSSCCDWRK